MATPSKTFKLTPEGVKLNREGNAHFERAWKDGFQGYVLALIAAGECYLKLKEIIPHGEWGKFIRRSCKMGERAVQRAMQLAKNKEDVEKMLKSSKTSWRTDLTISTIQGVIKALPAPPGKPPATPPEPDPEPTTPSPGPTPGPGRGREFLDCVGRAVPKDAKKADGVVDALSRIDEFKALMQDISRFKSQVLQAIDEDEVYVHMDKARWKQECESLYAAVKFATPYAICPYCWGDGCKNCRDSGWLGKDAYERVPEEIREPKK